MRRSILVLGLSAFWLFLAPATSACADYWFGDEEGFEFETGLAWVFRGMVIAEDWPADSILVSRTIRIDDTIAGTPGPQQLVIAMDSGCMAWWIEVGDRIIGAIPTRHTWTAPYAGITHHDVPAWVIKDGRVVGGRPEVGARVKGLGTIPRTESALVALLMRTPDTATAPAGSAGWAPPVILIGGLLGLLVARRRPQPSAATTSRSETASTSGR
jgi:hypothetical protein